MSNWYDAWADRYAEWSTGVDDVPFYVGLAGDADGPLVELAVGNGRVAIPVAQATGRRVIGIDSSPAMLAQARLRAVEEGVELDLRRGDMRELELEETAALIYCPGRSLMHLPTWADRRRCFERVAASLRHGSGRRRHGFPLVGDEERVARSPRRRRSAPRSALRRVRRRAVRRRQP